MKRFVTFIVFMVLCLTLVPTAFAAEGIPENATRHTVALTLQPEGASTNSSAAPYIWGDPSITMVENYTGYTGQFYVSDRYFAFECEGFLEDGNTFSNEGYSIGLELVGATTIASMSCHADSSLYKLDWIDIYTDGYYRFKVINGTDYTLTVYITYYSWN